MKKAYIILVFIFGIVLLSGCGEKMVKWSESMNQKMTETGENIGNKIEEKGNEVSNKIDSIASEGTTKPDPEVKNQVNSPTISSSEKVTETPKAKEEIKNSSDWNKDDKDIMSNNNIRFAVKLLTDNQYKFSKYTYAEQFDKLTKDPSKYYGKIISIAGTVTEISSLNKDFDAKSKTTLYADGIRTMLTIKVKGSSNANDRSILVCSTQPKDEFLLKAEYSISGFIVGTSMTKMTVNLQGQTETNYVELPVIVPDKELVHPMPREEYINGYLGAYNDNEFLEKMLNELRN
jgi:hypothetical protein